MVYILEGVGGHKSLGIIAESIKTKVKGHGSKDVLEDRRTGAKEITFRCLGKPFCHSFRRRPPPLPPRRNGTETDDHPHPESLPGTQAAGTPGPGAHSTPPPSQTHTFTRHRQKSRSVIHWLTLTAPRVPFRSIDRRRTSSVWQARTLVR